MNLNCTKVLFGALAFIGPLELFTDQQLPGPRELPIIEEQISFGGAIAQASAKMRGNHIADGSRKATVARLDLAGTRRDVLDAIGREFDYRWTEDESGDVVWRRRYGAYSEHPPIYRSEAELCIRRIVDALHGLGTRPSSGLAVVEIRNLFASLTAPQHEHLIRGNTFRLADLSSAQQTHAHRAIAHNALGTLTSSVGHLLTQLESVEESRLELAPPLLSTGEGLELQLVSKGGGKTICSPLPHRPGLVLLVSTPGPNGDPSKGSSRSPTDSLNRLVYDAQRPSSLVKALRSTRVTMELNNVTATNLAEGLSKHIRIPLAVTDDLALRLVSVVFQESSGERALRLLQNALGWEAYEVESGGILISRRSAPRVRDLGDVVLAVSQALPHDWRSFLFGEAAAGAPAMAKRLHDQAQVYAKGLEALVEAKGDKGRSLECRSLNENQKEQLVKCLFLDTFATVFEPGTHRSILSGRLLPFQRDPGSAFLSFKNSHLEIGSAELSDGSVRRSGFSGRVIGTPQQ